MRRFALILILLVGTRPALAATPPAAELTPQAAELNSLFDHLRRARDATEAGTIEGRIVEICSQSPSDTANLLYARGVEAMDDDKELALELFTAVTELEPNFAEAWQELGQVNYALDAQDAALLDLERTLVLEPRHYGALLGLSTIFETYGNKKAALDALRRAYAINPNIPELDKRIRALSLDVEGQRI